MEEQLTPHGERILEQIIAQLENPNMNQRTKSEVLNLRGSPIGCCSRFCDCQSCDCLETAIDDLSNIPETISYKYNMLSQDKRPTIEHKEPDELQAIELCWNIIAKFDSMAQRRIIEWLSSKSIEIRCSKKEPS